MADAWTVVAGALFKKFVFADFAEAFAFMTRVAALAEQHNHHPDWSNTWNVVEISLCSHDQGRTITQRDHDLARAIDELII
ncbi:MAG: 4a-hydroxytetrahydrobiopterin dehydratase [Acidimicrobiaceae bacterium]|nr:4a-hydroxytetrahydrobiopterin dehydratase [Acidimicrobiaceae bacterium]